MGAAANVRSRMTLRFRMRPLGMTSFNDAFHAVLITDSAGEQFFPGQAQKLYDALVVRKR
jgi:hypothetical protein